MANGPVLKIGDFSFDLPPNKSLNFDSDRSITKIKAPGAPTVYQDMGFNEKTLNFSGSIVGAGAWDTSQKLESLQWGGQEYQLSYGSIQKRVRIQKYSPKFIRDDRVDYTINLIVCYTESMIEALANTPTGSTATGTSATTSTSNNTPAKTSTRTYTIKYGDTLWSIAARSDVFGDGSRWEAIAQTNGITNERALQVGQVINLPATSTVASAVDSTGQSELTTIMGSAA